jgi:uncharacterized protein with LGFP repeats
MDENAFVGYPQINRNRQVGSGTGFLDAVFGAPANRTNVLNPSDYSYMQGYEKGEPLGIAAMAAPALAALLRSPQALARAASPLYRPQVTTEAAVTPSKTLLNASGSPEAELLSRQRYETAASPSLLRDVAERQGFWEGESNPLFVAKAERTLNVGKNPNLLKDVAQTAENLEQAGAAVTRVTPLPYGDLSKGNAALLTRNGKPLTNEDIKELNKALGGFGDTVVQHRAGGEGLIFKGGWDDSVSLQEMVDKAKSIVPGLKVKPALSTEGIDRKYFERPDYAQFGATPREANRKGQLTQVFDELLKAKGYRQE